MAIESAAAKLNRSKKIIATLRQEFPHAACALEHRNAFELLVATMLSAQCTDARVNMVTPELFRHGPTPQKMLDLGVGEIQQLIRSITFFNNKAKNIHAMSEILLAKHGGEVPRTMDELVALPGVGRKTANVVLGNAFDVPGLVVDTHVIRIANLLKLAKGTDAVKLEQQLEKVVPKEDWVHFTHLIILHGRKTCIARRPQCQRCGIAAFCPSRGLQLTVTARKLKA